MTGSSTLDVIDLDSVEQAVYEAVVAQQPVTREQLADTCEAVAERLAAAVESLLRKGLIGEAAGRQGQLIAAPPDIALGALLIDREEQLRRARLEVEKLAHLHQRVASFLTEPSKLIEVVSGREAVLHRFAQIQQASRSEIRIIDKPPYASPDAYGNVAVEQEQANRGVRYRAIYDPLGLSSFHDLTGDVQASIEAGVDARVLPNAPMKIVLADDRLAMIPLHNASEEIDSMVVVHPSALLDALSELFEQLWERSLPLVLPGSVAASLSTSAQDPTDDDRRLLSLLTAGLPDEAIAKHLDVSHRTMQRRLRVLLDRLGAQTRFQAALRAVALGWLPTPPADRPLREVAQVQGRAHSTLQRPVSPDYYASRAG